MITPPTAPSPGKPVSASFFSRLIAWVKSGQLIDGAGYRLHRTPNGTSIQFEIGKNKPATPVPLLWAFSCTEDPDTGERTGGWTNCRLQIGMNCTVASEDVFGEQDNIITGTEQTEDGVYYVEVDLRKETGEIKRKELGETVPESDVMHDKVNISIGEVVEKKLITCIDMIPVVYKYL